MSDSNGSSSNGSQVAKANEMVQATELVQSPAEVDADGTALPISPVQRQCMEYMQGGGSVTDAARFAGVSRSTVYRWMKNDPVFVAAMNEWKNEAVENARSRLVAMTNRAAMAVDLALSRDNPHIAMQLLKGLGVLQKSEPRYSDPDDVRRMMKVEDMRRQVEVLRDENQILVEMEEVAAGKGKG
jgi:phage terminase small subunit